MSCGSGDGWDSVCGEGGGGDGGGWLFVIIGAVMLITAIVHPLVLGDEGDGIL